VLAASGHAVQSVLSSIQAPPSVPIPRNWILTDVDLASHDLDSWVPYARLTGPNVDMARDEVRFVAGTLLHPSEMP
jgi:hypothetical protein